MGAGFFIPQIVESKIYYKFHVLRIGKELNFCHNETMKSSCFQNTYEGVKHGSD